MATSNSRLARPWLRRAAVAFAVAVTGAVLADEAQQKIFAARARAQYQRAKMQYETDAGNITNVWHFASAAFDAAEFSTNKVERAALANEGIAASRSLVARKSKWVAGHYYLAMNLGQLARTETIGALKIVKEMEIEFNEAADLDPRFDHAGPVRDLGLLYRDAPGWPVSIGNPSKARSFLRQSVRLAPDYPENYLHVIESYLKWNDPDTARRELHHLDAIWPAARTNLTGEKWGAKLDNWSTRRDAARKQLVITPAR
ncbi:MAG: hypothetical protein WDM80_11080 [Limisphaerales bacterium]